MLGWWEAGCCVYVSAPVDVCMLMSCVYITSPCFNKNILMNTDQLYLWSGLSSCLWRRLVHNWRLLLVSLQSKPQLDRSLQHNNTSSLHESMYDNWHRAAAVFIASVNNATREEKQSLCCRNNHFWWRIIVILLILYYLINGSRLFSLCVKQEVNCDDHKAARFD